MSQLAALHRFAAAACLVLYAVLAIVFVFTAPAPDGSTPPGAATSIVSAYAFLGAQAGLAIGIIGVAHLLRNRAPVTAPIAAGLLLLSAFAHSAFAGIDLVRAVSGFDAVEETITGAATLLTLTAMVGLVLGTIVLAVALFRARLGIWWVGVVLVGWIVIEFGLSGMGTWALVASGALLVAGNGGLAVAIMRSPLRDWMTVREAEVVGEGAEMPVGVVSR